MTERRDQDRFRSPVQRRKVAQGAQDEKVLDLGRQAGNRALAELLSYQPAHAESASPGLRILNSIRGARSPVQREFGLVVQRQDEQKAPGRLLKFGDQGSDVAMVQQMLGIDADGIFGPQTRAAVVAFQKSAGLAADGVVGPQTFSALSSSANSTGKSDIGRMKFGEQTLKQGMTDLTNKEAIPESTDKGEIPESTDKEAIPESTDKGAIPESTDKIPTSTDKIPTSTDKLEAFG